MKNNRWSWVIISLLLLWTVALMVYTAKLYLEANPASKQSEQKVSNEIRPTLNILYNAEEQPAEKSVVAQLLQSQFGKQGIDIKLEPVPNTIYAERIAKGDYESTLALWYLDYDDPEGFLTDFYSKAGYRVARYNDPKFDQLYLDGLLAPNDTQKLQAYREAALKLQQDMPWIPLFSNTEIFLMKPEAVGFQSNAYQYYDYRQVALEHISAASDVEVQTLDPALAYDLASKHLVTQSYEGLIAMDKDTKIIPALASEWSFSQKGDVLTFKLRKGVYFHKTPLFKKDSQRELTADDVKASFERLLKSNSPYAYIFDHVQGIEAFKNGKAKSVSGFQATDPYTFKIALSQPFPTMLPWLLAPAAYILPKELPDKYDFSRGSVGTGPFILKNWDGVTAQFDGNPDYWQKGQPIAKTLALRIIKDVNTLVTAFKRGETDILNVPLALFNDVFDKQGEAQGDWKRFTYREVKLNNLKFLAFNMEKAPWGKDNALRTRAATAIDKAVVTEQLFKGKARVADSIIPSGIAGFE